MMNRRNVLKLISTLPAWLGGCSYKVNKKPNVIFLLVDDQRNDTLGCVGHPFVKTPNIDNIAANGAIFRNAFVTTSICPVSRASILSGLYESTHNFTFGTPPLKKEFLKQSYPILLRAIGYRTGFIGKFGIHSEYNPNDLFDIFKPINRGPYFKMQSDGTTRHTTELAADSAIKFIAESDGTQPFCLSVSFNAVHAEDDDKENHFPWPKAVEGMYEDIQVPRPRLSDPEIFEALPDFLKTSLNRVRYHWRWDNDEKYQKNMRAYFRMISGVDHAIGRITDFLKSKGLHKDTIIIYSADNGYYMGDRGLAGKWSHYDQSLRIPLIISDPRLKKEQLKGVTFDQIALNVDLSSTILDMCGIKHPDYYQGHSLYTILKGETPSKWRKYFFCEHHMNHPHIPKWIGIRGERFVYARYFQEQPKYEFLHDFKTDPDQLLNLAKSPDHKDLLHQLRQKTDEHHKNFQETRSKLIN